MPTFWGKKDGRDDKLTAIKEKEVAHNFIFSLSDSLSISKTFLLFKCESVTSRLFAG